MGLTVFTKIGIYGHKSLREDVLGEIQRFGVVEIIDPPKQNSGDSIGESHWREKLQKARFCLDSLSGFSRKNLLESFLPSKLDISAADYLSALDNFPFEEFYIKSKKREAKLQETAVLKDKLKDDYVAHAPWEALKFPASELKPTASTSFHLIRVNKRNLPGVEKKIGDAGFIEIINQTKNAAYCLAGVLTDKQDKLNAAVAKVDGEFITLDPGGLYAGMTPREAAVKIKNRLASVEQEEEQLKIEKQKDAGFLQNIMIIHDQSLNSENRRGEAARARLTDSVFHLQGWIPEKQVKLLEAILEKKFPETFIEALSPGRDEKPPVALSNSPAVEPFETITGLYGLPGRSELDPTPFLAPFFVLFFAVCMTDAGYGAVVLALSVLLAKKMKMGAHAMKFMKLLALAGAATIVVGALTGGFFGIQPSQVPEKMSFMLDIRSAIMLFDPMEQFLVFMLISLGLGFLQVWFGYMVKMIQGIKAGRARDAVLSQMPWIVILPGFLLLGITRSPETVLLGVVEQSPLGEGWAGVSLAMIYAGIAGMFIQPGSRGILKKTGGGVYSLYGLIGCLGDILSYVRLFALGLATVAMAIAINTMAAMAAEIPVIGFAVAFFIAVGGHLANVAINALSAFIHTVRLQFVEFFTKFYGGGGRIFRPFAYETEFIEEKNIAEHNSN